MKIIYSSFKIDLPYKNKTLRLSITYPKNGAAIHSCKRLHHGENRLYIKENNMPDKKILVIDDDPDILESILAILQSEGYNVVTAVDGKEGLEKFKSSKPDLVLCDMMMERVDAGSKVAEMIRKEDKKTPVYLLSSIGNATAGNISIDELGFNGVFQKPVNPENLLSQIKKTLNV